MGWFFIALLQFGLVAAVKQGTIGLLLFSSIVLFYWYFLRKMLARRRAFKVFNESSFKDKKVYIDVDEKGFEVLNHEGKRVLEWKDIKEVMPVGDDILIFSPPNFYYIPSGAFASIEDKNSLKKLARKEGVFKTERSPLTEGKKK